jgi:hypothetical protein
VDPAPNYEAEQLNTRRQDADLLVERAIAVDDDYDDTGVEFVLNRLQCVERTPDSETWEFVGDPVHCETFSSVEELASQWLRG